MKVDVFFSNSMENCVCGILKNIDKTKDISKDNIIICPDSFSLLLEKKIFECLEIECMMNIKVLGISKLFNLLSIDTNLIPLTAFESAMIVRKIILENKNCFQSFKSEKVSFGFCDEVYKTIAQLKANKVGFEDLKKYNPTQKSSLFFKLSDISIIFEKYEQIIKDNYIDSNDVLFLIENAISKNEKVSTSDFYFVGFESMTKQGYSILNSCVKNANRVVVGVMASENQQNEYLYENDMMDKIKNICNENDCIINFNKLENVLNEKQTHIIQNLLSLSSVKIFNDGYFKLYDFPCVRDEISNCAKQIFDFVLFGKRYNQIQIAVCDLEKYKKIIEVVFKEKNIPVFIDSKEKFSDVSVVSFILSILKMIAFNFEFSLVKTFANNEYLKIEREKRNLILSHIDFYLSEGDSFLFDEFYNDEKFLPFKEKLDFFIGKKHILESGSSVESFVLFLEEIFEVFQIEKQIEEKIAKFQEKNDLKSEKIFSQITSKFKVALESMKKVSKNEVLSFENFVSLCEQLFEGIEIKTIPISVDCVYVGDMASSYFENKDVLFVLGANEGKCPFYSVDCGIISDGDIKELKKVFAVEPSIKMINRRNRFKVFQNFSKAKNNLFVSFVSTGEDGKKSLPSSFATGMLNVFKCKEDEPSMFEIFAESVAKMENSESFILHNCQSESEIKTQLAHAIKNENKNLQEKILQFLEDKNVNLDFFHFNKKNDSFKLNNKSNELFFSENKARITQIQNYFRCPFKHFLENGLKIRKKTNSKISAIDFGNIIHKCLEIFSTKFKNKIGELSKEEIFKICNIIFAEVLKMEEFSQFCKNKENKESLIRLEKEIACVFYEINTQQKVSELKINKSEFKFSEEVVLNSNGDKIVFSGVVDRIDTDEENFKIVDYKTGNIHSEPKLIYHGIDLQVLLYSKIIENKFNLKPVGSFYFPVCDDYVKKDNEKKKFLKGYFISEENFVKKLDNRLSLKFPQSDICNIKLKTAKQNIEKNLFEVSKNLETLSEKGYENLCSLTLETISLAVSEIKNGNITPSPLENECDFCPFFALCNCSQNEKRSFVLSSKELTEEVVSQILNCGGQKSE